MCKKENLAPPVQQQRIRSKGSPSHQATQFFIPSNPTRAGHKDRDLRSARQAYSF